MTDRAVTVVKLGGAVCRDGALLGTAVDAIGILARSRRLFVIPGGGAFADTVRRSQAQLHFSDSAAHWMAVLAMDQVAELIADRLGGALVLHNPTEAPAAWSRGEIPVLAPCQWLRANDGLPHSWDISSDSIAAFVANRIEAGTLLLVKPVSGAWEELVDPGFAALRGTLSVRACTPAELRTLAAG